MRKFVAFVPMYAVYWFGDGVSRIMNVVPDVEAAWAQRAVDVLYPIYNRCMCWSAELNDWAGFKLWTDSVPDD